MAFVVETGQGREDANSYASVAMLKAYCADRGVDLGDKTDEALQGALVAATDWIDANYSTSFLGAPSFVQQALQYPRTGVANPAGGQCLPVDYMPPKLIKATCILAIEAQAGKLYNTVRGASPQLIEKTTGPLTKKYSPLAPADQLLQPTFPEVQNILRALVRSLGFMTVTR